MKKMKWNNVSVECCGHVVLTSDEMEALRSMRGRYEFTLSSDDLEEIRNLLPGSKDLVEMGVNGWQYKGNKDGRAWFEDEHGHDFSFTASNDFQQVNFREGGWYDFQFTDDRAQKVIELKVPTIPSKL